MTRVPERSDSPSSGDSSSRRRSQAALAWTVVGSGAGAGVDPLATGGSAISAEEGHYHARLLDILRRFPKLDAPVPEDTFYCRQHAPTLACRLQRPERGDHRKIAPVGAGLIDSGFGRRRRQRTFARC